MLLTNVHSINCNKSPPYQPNWSEVYGQPSSPPSVFTTAAQYLFANCNKPLCAPENCNGEKSLCANCDVPLCASANCENG
ncbi:hypothetical protein DPMN_163448 [Dreissena polymorpha]|uniref:Uncharacterized protein n=1 Tax=Dreissena polymorpha TaxID=45954 RepID=A0A9D4IST9_DREPO|nr:hypothetical protein DPMN_163448 [Dreissena polymorpha]